MIESADWKLGKTNAVEGFYTIVNCISKCSLKNLIFTWRNLSLLVISYLLIIRLQRKFLFLAFNYNVYSI